MIDLFFACLIDPPLVYIVSAHIKTASIMPSGICLLLSGYEIAEPFRHIVECCFDAVLGQVGKIADQKKKSSIHQPSKPEFRPRVIDLRFDSHHRTSTCR
jgi:hypothetical protein